MTHCKSCKKETDDLNREEYCYDCLKLIIKGDVLSIPMDDTIEYLTQLAWKWTLADVETGLKVNLHG